MLLDDAPAERAARAVLGLVPEKTGSVPPRMSAEQGCEPRQTKGVAPCGVSTGSQTPLRTCIWSNTVSASLGVADAALRFLHACKASRAVCAGSEALLSSWLASPKISSSLAAAGGGTSCETLLLEGAALLLDASATEPARSVAERTLPNSLTALTKRRHCGSIVFFDAPTVDTMLLLPYDRPSRCHECCVHSRRCSFRREGSAAAVSSPW